jgi:hypothetical protein
MNGKPPQLAIDIANALSKFVINPLLLLIFAGGMLVFIYGIVEYMWGLTRGQNTNDGKMHMLWGLVGMFVMAAAYGILRFIASSLGAPATDYIK